MEAREAQELIRMVESNWHCDFGAQTRELWRSALESYDCAMVTKAVANMARRPLPNGRARPTLADLREHVIALASLDSAEAWRELPAGPIPKPAWVQRWKRARAEGDFRVFPEQIPGYLSLQKEHPLNVSAYALPASPQGNESEWIQPHEYAEAVT